MVGNVMAFLTPAQEGESDEFCPPQGPQGILVKVSSSETLTLT